MPDDIPTFVMFTAFGLLVAVAIFLSALFFVNSARKGNRRFKWENSRWASRFLRHPK